MLISAPGKPEEKRIGRVVEIDPALYHLWGDLETYISQLELMVVLAAMVECASFLRQSRGVWFIDNVWALMALVNWRSNVD